MRATLPPQLAHRPSPARAQSCRRGTGCHRVAPEVWNASPGGAGAERAGGEGRSPTPLAVQRLQQPDQDSAETPTRDRFSRGFSSEGAGGVSGSSAPPGTMGLSRTRSLQTSGQAESAYGLAASSTSKGDCRSDSVSRASLGVPSPSAVKLSHPRARRPGQDCQKKKPKTQEKVSPVSPLPKTPPTPASINPREPPPPTRGLQAGVGPISPPAAPPHPDSSRNLGFVPRACQRAVTADRAPLSRRQKTTPHSQNHSTKGGATLVVLGSGRHRNRNGHRRRSARWWWNGGLSVCVLKHQTVSRLLLDSWENASPEHALGVRFSTSALPSSLKPPHSPHPAFWDVCQGGNGDPDGSLPAPLARSTLARLLLFFFLHGRSAKGLRKLPAPSPSGARSRGPRHTPGQARPAPPAPTPGPLTPRRDPGELAAPRAEPSGGRVERSSSPSRTLERHAERAVSPPEVLNFTLSGFSGCVRRASARLAVGDQGYKVTRSAWLLGHCIHLLFVQPRCAPAQPEPLLSPPAPPFDAFPGTPPSPLGPPSRSGHPLRPLCSRPLSSSLAAELGLAGLLL